MTTTTTTTHCPRISGNVKIFDWRDCRNVKATDLHGIKIGAVARFALLVGDKITFDNNFSRLVKAADWYDDVEIVRVD